MSRLKCSTCKNMILWGAELLYRRCTFCNKVTCDMCMYKQGRFEQIPIGWDPEMGLVRYKTLFRGDHDNCELSITNNKNKKIVDSKTL